MSIKNFAIAMITALVILSAGFASPASADDFEPFTIVFDVDFRSDDYGIFMDITGAYIDAYWVNGAGWRMVNNSSPSTNTGFAWYFDAPQFHIEPDGSAIRASALTDVQVTLYYDASVALPLSTVRVRRTSSSDVTNLAWSIPDAPGGAYVWQSPVTSSFGGSGQRLSWLVGNGQIPGEGQSMTLQRVYITATCNSELLCGDAPTPQPDTPSLTRPLRANEYGITGDTPMVNNADALAAFSNAPGQRVFAAEAGTVSLVEVVNVASCDALGLESQQSIYNCLVSELQAEPGSGITSLYRIPTINLQSDLFDIVPVLAQNPNFPIPQSILDFYRARKRAQIVTVQGESGTWRYWVWAAERYIAPGSSVEAGQCLGETISLEIADITLGASFSGPDASLAFNNASQGVTFVEPPSGIPLSAISRGGDSLEPAGICSVIPSAAGGTGEELGGISGRFAACLADVDLSNRASWQSSGATWDSGNRVRIDAGGFIRSTLNLDMARDPVLMISWRWSGQSEGGRITLGEETRAFDRQTYGGPTADPSTANFAENLLLAGYSYQLDEWDLPDSPSASGFYDLRVSPVSGANNFEIEYICIYNRLDGEGEPADLGVPHCYFDNFNFAQGIQGWGASTSPAVIASVGKPVVPDMGWISQTASLSDGDGVPADYTLNVKWGVYDTSSDWIHNHPNLEVEVWYEFGALTNNEFVYWNTITQPEIIARENYITMGTVIFVDVGESQTADLKVQFRISGGDASTLGVQVFEVCLDGDFSPGIPTFRADCSVVPTPAGDNLGQWTVYHWRQLNRFFQCDLMVFLNEMDNRIREFFSTATMFFRWVIVSFNIVMTWVSSDLLFWLNGHLHNISNGNVTFIEGGAQTCNSIWCALGALFGGGASIFDSIATVIVSAIEEIFAPIIELVSFLVSGAFTFFTSVAQQVLELLFYAVRLLLEVVVNLFGLLERIIYDMTTAEPIPIPHAPYCATDPGGNAWCRLSWVAENTIFTGPGAAIIPLISGYIAVMLILWVISEIKRSIIESGSLL